MPTEYRVISYTFYILYKLVDLLERFKQKKALVGVYMCLVSQSAFSVRIISQLIQDELEVS